MYGAPAWRHLQKILNESWPLQDPTGERHARGIPDQPYGIPADARVVWEHDGEEIIHGKAWRWINAYVCVVFHDPRWQGLGVWLRASDVTRQQQPRQ